MEKKWRETRGSSEELGSRPDYFAGAALARREVRTRTPVRHRRADILLPFNDGKVTVGETVEACRPELGSTCHRITFASMPADASRNSVPLYASGRGTTALFLLDSNITGAHLNWALRRQQCQLALSKRRFWGGGGYGEREERGKRVLRKSGINGTT